MKKDPILDSLKKASKGLRYTSDTDAPLQPFLWKNGGDTLTDEGLLKLAGAEEGAEVETTTLDGFFHAVPSEDKAKFQALQKVLEAQLSGIKVYKVGDEAEKEAYIVGKTQDGQWAGLKTTVVES